MPLILGFLLVTLMALSGWGLELQAQRPDDLSGLTDQELYKFSCANCHGLDGRGLDRSLIGFEEEIPDFTDCDFAAREPDADWIAVAHEGGPVRGFSEMMPAFRGALNIEQLERVMAHIRTFCTDTSWPRGELNFPRALLTEKAYPEDEWVIEAEAAVEGEGSVGSAFVYERRFGPRSQIEVRIPYGWRHQRQERDPRGRESWASGLGDVTLGMKHALHHSIESGTIFSLGAEVILPTGDEGKGLGADGALAEAFASFGKILPSDAFVQAQAGVELPLHSGADKEIFGRLVLGRGFSQGQWGRSWTPMVELSVERSIEDNAVTDVDIVPQVQVSLNTRQHVLANVGLLVPATHRAGRSVRLLFYVLLDWFDGGFFEGW